MNSGRREKISRKDCRQAASVYENTHESKKSSKM